MNCNYRGVIYNTDLDTIYGTVITGIGGSLRTVMGKTVVKVTKGWHYTPLSNKKRDPEYHFNIEVPGDKDNPKTTWHVHKDGTSALVTFYQGEAVFLKQNSQQGFKTLLANIPDPPTKTRPT